MVDYGSDWSDDVFEGVDKEGSKDGNEGRDDVGAGMASGHEGASLGWRV